MLFTAAEEDSFLVPKNDVHMFWFNFVFSVSVPLDVLSHKLTLLEPLGFRGTPSPPCVPLCQPLSTLGCEFFWGLSLLLLTRNS